MTNRLRISIGQETPIRWRHPRLVHRLWAKLNGFFWLPCPNCGRHFGGHEWAGHLWITPGQSTGTCSHPKCLAQVKARERADWSPGGRMWEMEAARHPDRMLLHAGPFYSVAITGAVKSERQS